MKNYKNYLIAILSGLLILSLSTQQSSGAGTSQAAKIAQYAHCLSGQTGGVGGTELGIELCRKYQP